jgi:hypothetical protein
MTNAEGNPNDKIQNDSQRLAQDSIIRASSFLSRLENCRGVEIKCPKALSLSNCRPVSLQRNHEA